MVPVKLAARAEKSDKSTSPSPPVLPGSEVIRILLTVRSQASAPLNFDLWNCLDGQLAQGSKLVLFLITVNVNAGEVKRKRLVAGSRNGRQGVSGEQKVRLERFDTLPDVYRHRRPIAQSS